MFWCIIWGQGRSSSMLICRRVQTHILKFKIQLNVNIARTSKGLKLHQNHKHPIEYHKERGGKSYSKCLWSTEECNMLAEIELELIKSGCINFNVEAHKKFQHRTLEAVKCHSMPPSGLEVWGFYNWKVGFRKSGSKEWPKSGNKQNGTTMDSS